MGDYVYKSKVEGSFIRQNSREQTTTLGDSNTEFFFGPVQMRRVTNKITCLVRIHGHVLEGMEKIGDACEAYYKELCALEMMPNVDVSEFHDINPRFTINEEIAAFFLQVEVTKEEVQGVLVDIQDDKAPGNDGFTSFFYKTSWEIGGGDFVKAIHNFFPLQENAH